MTKIGEERYLLERHFYRGDCEEWDFETVAHFNVHKEAMIAAVNACNRYESMRIYVQSYMGIVRGWEILDDGFLEYEQGKWQAY